MVKLFNRGKPEERYKPPRAPVIVGFDVGQRPDPSAAVFVERWVENIGEPEFIEKQRLLGDDGWVADEGETRPFSRQTVRLGYEVRHIETTRDTSYPEQATKMVDALQRNFGSRAPFRDGKPGKRVVLVVDDTGVGRAMTDELRHRIRKASGDPHITLMPVTITAGNVSHFDKEHWRWYVPKFELINAAVIALEDGRLQWSKRVRGWEELEKELRNYKRIVHLHTGKASYDTGLLWREGAHDDRVLALALGIWMWERNRGEYVDTPLDTGKAVEVSSAPEEYTPITGTPIPPAGQA